MRFFLSPLTLIVQQWVLLRRLTQREFEARYRGSVLGLAWAVIAPAAMMGIYTVVFFGILSSRWPGYADDRTAYALNLLAGLTVFNVAAECLNRAPRLILENPSYVKKLVFPVEILPVVALMSASISAFFSGFVLLIFQVALAEPPFLTIFLLPVLALPFLLFCLGASYLLAALGVFLRDIGQLTGPLVMALMFLSPVFYASDIVPLPWRAWLWLNPLAATIEWVRGALFLGALPAAHQYFAQLALGILLLALGYRVFMSLRPGFADVI